MKFRAMFVALPYLLKYFERMDGMVFYDTSAHKGYFVPKTFNELRDP